MDYSPNHPLLVDELIRFQAEAGRVIAGCAFEYPLAVLDLLTDVPIDRLIDLQATRFIKALAARREELEGANYEQAIVIAIEAAGEDIPAIISWLSWPDDGDVLNIAHEAIRDIKELPAASIILTKLAHYIDSEMRYQLENQHEPPPVQRSARIG